MSYAGIIEENRDLKAQLRALTQATNCARCGEFKHTPLRLDDGYVCAGCIEVALNNAQARVAVLESDARNIVSLIDERNRAHREAAVLWGVLDWRAGLDRRCDGCGRPYAPWVPLDPGRISVEASKLIAAQRVAEWFWEAGIRCDVLIAWHEAGQPES